ncbi:hypothetical protein ABBQ32_009191 [Trebouxia sp. C0010 RCD-2024]
MRLHVASNCTGNVASLRALTRFCPSKPSPQSLHCNFELGPQSRHCQLSSSKGRRLCRTSLVGATRAAALATAGSPQLPQMLQTFLSPAALALTVFSAMAISAWTSVRRKAKVSEVTTQPTQFNKGVLSRCPTINSPYKPFPFLTNGHVETIFASKTRRSPPVTYERASFACPDGGTVHLDYHDLPSNIILPDDAPVLILLPGLTGGSHDSYVRHMVGAASMNGMRAVVFNSRGTSDGAVTSPQFYSASYTGDMRRVVQMVQKRYPSSELLAAGWSLGGNILVRYLGEEGASCPISAAASLCNPLDLAISDDNFHVGFNKIYDKNLARSLRTIFKKHSHLFKGLEDKYDLELANTCTSIRDFDDAITRRTFGQLSLLSHSSSFNKKHILWSGLTGLCPSLHPQDCLVACAVDSMQNPSVKAADLFYASILQLLVMRAALMLRLCDVYGLTCL